MSASFYVEIYASNINATWSRHAATFVHRRYLIRLTPHLKKAAIVKGYTHD
jgi:hypothetical protein